LDNFFIPLQTVREDFDWSSSRSSYTVSNNADNRRLFYLYDSFQITFDMTVVRNSSTKILIGGK